MQLKPIKEILSMSKEKAESWLAGPRAKRLKLQANLEMSQLECEIEALEGKIQEMLADKEGLKEFNFKSLLDLLDKRALLARRLKEYDKLLKQLFPED